jgi:hypothetical protein
MAWTPYELKLTQLDGDSHEYRDTVVYFRWRTSQASHQAWKEFGETPKDCTWRLPGIPMPRKSGSGKPRRP